MGAVRERVTSLCFISKKAKVQFEWLAVLTTWIDTFGQTTIIENTYVAGLT